MKKLLLVISIIAVSGPFSGCVKKSTLGDLDLNSKETLRVNLSTEPPSLDWHKSADTTSSQVIINMMDGLVSYNLADKELGLSPALATSWEAAEKGRMWTITLRNGVTWTDGVEFTAQHVLDAWERLLNPATAADYAYFLFSIKNAKEYNQGKVKDFSEVGVKMLAKNKFVVELNAPMSYFPYLLTHHSTFPIRKDVVAKFGDHWTDPANIQTLGSYHMKSWAHDKAIVLERNDKYYGDKAKTKFILMHMINEQATALNLFETGKLDAVVDLPSAELQRLKTKPEYREIGNLLLYYYGFNIKKKPFDNPDIRKAINCAIDRRQLVQVLAGGQIPMTSWIPTGMFGYEASRGLSFDLEKAKAYLKKAGYSDPAKVPKIVIGFNTNDDHKKIAENIQSQLKKNLGVNVELQNEEWKVYLNHLKTDAHPIFRMGWLADYPDPDNFMNLMTSYSENNYTGWKNPAYDRLIEQASGELNKEKRRQIYSKAQALLVEQDVPAVPLYGGVVHMLISKRVENFPINNLGVYSYKNVSIKQ